jgi:hypothetical protein
VRNNSRISMLQTYSARACRANGYRARWAIRNRTGVRAMSTATTGRGSSALELLEQETIARVKWRLIPLLFLCYYAAYLDRVNVGFAALHMNGTWPDRCAFGLGGGIFFVGYFLEPVQRCIVKQTRHPTVTPCALPSRLRFCVHRS